MAGKPKTFTVKNNSDSQFIFPDGDDVVVLKPRTRTKGVPESVTKGKGFIAHTKAVEEGGKVIRDARLECFPEA